MSYREGDSVSGEKIFCEGYGIQKPYPCVQSDEHHGKCANVNHGKCEIRKKFRWIKDKQNKI